MMPASKFSVATISAAGVFAALLSAPAAEAIPECIQTGITTTQCQRPGNAQITTSPGYINNYPSIWPFWGGNSIGISIGLFG